MSPWDWPVVILAVGSVLIAADYVGSPQSIDRARAHDRWILRILGLFSLALACTDVVPAMVVLLGWVGYWRDDDLRLLLVSQGLAAVWVAAPLIAPWAPVIAAGWVVVALLEGAATLVDLVTRHRWPLAKSLNLSGWHGQHTFFAGGLAIVFPLSMALGWGAALAVGAGILGISSWVGILALLTGLTWVIPSAWPLTVGIIGLAILVLIPKAIIFIRGQQSPRSLLYWTPRGDGLRSIRLRLQTWGLLVRLMLRWDWRTWLTGRGWIGPNQDILRGYAMKAVPNAQGTPHCDLLEVVYANGLLGLALVGALVWRVGPHLHLGDPFSAAVVAGTVVAMFSHAIHYPSAGFPWWLCCAWVAS